MPQQISPKHLVETKTGLGTALATAFRWHALRIVVAGGLTLVWFAGASIASAAAPCCGVTNVTKNGEVTAQETNGARTFQFQVADPALLRGLRVGSPVYANFDTKQVSLDGKKPCCKILNISTAAKQPMPGTTPAAPGSANSGPGSTRSAATTGTKSKSSGGGLGSIKPGDIPPVTTSPEPSTAGAMRGRPSTSNTTLPMGTGPGRPGPSTPLGAAGAGVAATYGPLQRYSEPLPQVTAGTIRPAQTSGSRADMRLASRARDPNILQLRGIDEIRAAPGLRQEAKDFLVLHARTLEAQEEDGYIVNRKLAEEWFNKNPKVPDSVHEAAKDKKKKKKGCSTKHISMGCVKTEIKQAEEDITNTWRKAWRDVTNETERTWNKAQGCFSDHNLAPLKVPVKFSVTPEFPVNVQRGGVSGNVTVGVPVAGDFMTQLKLFYIPCLPFAIRPKTLGADGTMETGGTLRANLTLTGQFDHTFLVPPSGGVKIPIQVIPIVIAGVPVAEMDVSVYVEGNVKIDGKGTLNGDVKLQSTQKTAFDFECSGHGCDLNHHGVPSAPATAMESIKLDGRVHVKPAIYTALQLSFDWELLEARAGPQPFLLGELYGCAAASGTQSTSGASTSTGSQAIVADLDWGLDIRAEALAAKKKVAYKKFKIDVSKGTDGKNAHLYFKDLVQSTGLVPVVTGASQATVGQPTAYIITMPECYPYRNAPDNSLKYHVTWTGGASAVGGAPAEAQVNKRGGLGLTKTSSGSPSSTCNFEGEQGACSGAPTSNTAFNLTWPASGDYVLTVAPVDDKHGHKFDGSRAKQVNIRVQ